MKRSKYQVVGTLAAASLIFAGVSVGAPLAFAGDPLPTAAAILVKGGAVGTIHVDLSPYISGNDAKVIAVTEAGGPSLAPLQSLTLDPDAKGFTVTMPDWPSDAERQTGMSWLYDYVIQDSNIAQATATIRVEMPRDTLCEDSISTIPQAVSRTVSGVPVTLDFVAMCQFDSTQYGPELAVGQNAVIDVAPVTALGAKLTAIPGSNQLRWSYDPSAQTVSGPDWVDFTLTDSIGRTVSDRVMVMVDGATPLFDVYGQGAATATSTRSAGAVTVDALEGLDWARGAGSATPAASVLVTDAPTNGTATAQADGTVLYTANAGWHGADSFNYTVHYTAGTVLLRAGTVNLSITERPTAMSQVMVKARSGAPVAADVLRGSVGKGLAIDSVTKPAHGAIEVLSSGQLQYTSSADYIGADQVVATLQDELGQRVDVTVEVSVSSAIGAVDLTTRGLRGDPVVTAKGAVALGDYESVTGRNATHGTVTSAGSGLIFVPEPGFVGTASYEVVVKDRFGAQATSTVTVHVLAKLVGLDVWVETGQEQAVRLSV